MKVDRIEKEGTTITRKSFWDGMAGIVGSLEKKESRNVSVNVHHGLGTIVNVTRELGTSAPITCDTETVLINFDGIEFDCGCVPFENPPVGSFIITDPGNVNSFTVEASLALFFDPCGDCDGELWYPIFDTTHLPHYEVSYWNEDPDCDGLPSGTGFNEYIGVALVLISGTFHLVAWTTGLVFYGSTTDITSPIVNILECDPEFSTDSVLECIFGVGADFNRISHGGTATVSIP